jgi:two-component system nitrogen regulation response regulator GlnG
VRKVLIVDDEPSVRFVLARTCERAGVPWEEAGSAEEAREKLSRNGASREGIGLVLLDVRLPGDDGFKLLGELSQRSDSPFVVVMTAEDTMRSAVEAMKRGAADYLGKPFDLTRVERLVKDLAIGPEAEHGPDEGPEHARPHAPEGDDEGGERPGPKDVAIPDMLIGRSPAMVEVYKEIGRVARTEMTVLLMGESGTGKELVARAIHGNSSRARGPFVTVNMAAIPRDLMESELYGHEKGSFTGAVERRPGKFELANGGTLFLDEIGEIPLPLQVKLLKVLEENEVRRVGGARVRKLDVRIVAATNRDLREMTRNRLFREDLFFRLNVFPIRIPPLRERPEDVHPLVDRIVAELNRRYKKSRRVRPEMLDLLARYPFPGNVRELQNVVERAFILADGKWIGPEYIPAEIHETALSSDPGLVVPLPHGEAGLSRILAGVERGILERLLSECGTTYAMAERLKVNQSTVVRKLRKLGIRAHPGG